jgi:hypothetical protein
MDQARGYGNATCALVHCRAHPPGFQQQSVSLARPARVVLARFHYVFRDG